MTRHLYIVLIMHTQLFYWAAQILHRVFDISIWIPTLHLDDDDDDDEHHFFVAKQQTTSLSNKVLNMLLHAQQVMPCNDYICDVFLVQTLVLYGNSLYLLDDSRNSQN